jgi:hypothetical protein
MKAVIRHLPHNTPAEDISDGLVSFGFDVISVKQMTATRRSPSDGSITINLPRFLITLPRTAKSQEASATSQSGRRYIEVKMVFRSAITASSSDTSGQNASNLPAAFGAEAVTCTRSFPIFHLDVLQM